MVRIRVVLRVDAAARADAYLMCTSGVHCVVWRRLYHHSHGRGQAVRLRLARVWTGADCRYLTRHIQVCTLYAMCSKKAMYF